MPLISISKFSVKILLTIALIFSYQAPVKASPSLLCFDNYTWGNFLTPGVQLYEKGVNFKTDTHSFMPITYGELKGPVAKLYTFFVTDLQKNCIVAAISVGSYNVTTEASRASGRIGPDERLYHVDDYRVNSHSTLGMMKIKPSYDSVKTFVIDMFKE
ncbi:MAG: hypothetical protein V7776_10140 [Halopseudomonas aestusnigri]